METLAFTRGKSIKRSLDIGLAREWPEIIEKCYESLVLEKNFSRNTLKLGSYDNDDKQLVIEFYWKFHNPSVSDSRTYTIEYNVEAWEISGTIVRENEVNCDPYADESRKIFKIEPSFYQNWDSKEMAQKFFDIFRELETNLK